MFTLMTKEVYHMVRTLNKACTPLLIVEQMNKMVDKILRLPKMVKTIPPKPKDYIQILKKVLQQCHSIKSSLNIWGNGHIATLLASCGITHPLYKGIITHYPIQIRRQE